MPLRVITTDLHIALLLSEYKQIELIITGGRVDNSSQSCIGNHSLTLLENINPDIAFVSCNSWSLEKGVTAPTEEKANLKECSNKTPNKKYWLPIAANMENTLYFVQLNSITLHKLSQIKDYLLNIAKPCQVMILSYH
ncbi:DNA-binding transcriptional regulator AgaR [Mannheimia haemolytica]|nr:DNA-binding transcriptional regulator AgaR [Mannheimia haemolytica]